jgi:hypothetical protein
MSEAGCEESVRCCKIAGAARIESFLGPRSSVALRSGSLDFRTSVLKNHFRPGINRGGKVYH